MKENETMKYVEKCLYELSYYFSKEMREEEKKQQERAEEIKKEAAKKGEPAIIVIVPTNIKCMGKCLDETNAIIDYIKDDETRKYVEEWQLAGIKAMFEKCGQENIVPYDLPAAIQAVLGMWEELGKLFE